MAVRVAIVTGGNKGVGFAIVKALCQQHPEWKVYLTARSEERGKASIEELKKLGCSPNFCQLDIESEESIQKAKSYFQKTYGGVDVFVNNAAFAYKAASKAPFSEQAEVTMRINFFATLNVCNAFIPILNSGARLVNVASMAASMVLKKTSPELQKLYTSDQLTMEQLVESMNAFVAAAKDDVHEKKGWPSWAYGVTKVGVLCMSRIIQRDFDKDSRQDLVCNAVCPGWVKTDMAGDKAPLTPDQGAETPVYAATLPPNTDIKGCFLSEKKIREWKAT